MTSTTPRIITMALAALALAVPAASAMPSRDDGVRTSSLAGTYSAPAQDLRNPENRPLSSLPSYPVATQPRQDPRSPDARDASRPNETEFALERYYSTYGEPEPLPVADAPAPVDEDTPWLPIAVAIAVTLTIVAASATRLRRLRVRRTARAVP